jgi:uncharacterized membrane protein
MTDKVVTLTGLVALIGLVSCTSGDGGEDSSRDVSSENVEQTEGTETAPGLQTIRGHYVFGHEIRTFRPCGQDEELWVFDRSNLLKELHEEMAPETVPYAEIFVVATGRIGPPVDEGFGAEFPGAVTVEDVIYATFEGFDCGFDWSRFFYRAQGNEPSWMLEVFEAEMRLTRPGYPDLVWADTKESRSEGTVTFHAAGGGDHPPVELVIELAPSRDTMSGAYYGLSARLVLGDQTLKGNALRGAEPAGP